MSIRTFVTVSTARVSKGSRAQRRRSGTLPQARPRWCVADLVRVAKTYFRPERLLAVAVGPRECERALRRAVVSWARSR